MASVTYVKLRDTHRVFYRLKVRGKLIDKAKYAKKKAKANLLKRELERVESATRTGIVSTQEIEGWLDQGWIKKEEAEGAFLGYEESAQRRRRGRVEITDYNAVLAAYEDYALATGKGSEERKSYRNHVSLARQVIDWLKAEFPDVSRLTSADVSARMKDMKGSYTDWTIYHHATKLRLLLDQAVVLGMIHENPARAVQLGQPRKSTTRRILDEEEIHQILEASLQYENSSLVSGMLPTIVRLGLYAGLRNEEMCWLKWEAIDFRRRIISIHETYCEETSETWKPKDFEARRIDVKEACIDHIRKQKRRLKTLGFESPFVLVSRRLEGSRGQNSPVYQVRNRPLTQEVPQKAFAKMINAEGLDRRITVYSLRHTFATMALRAGVDIRTLQMRMGHSDIKTTMEYLHFIEPERHPLDKLPY